MVGITWRELVTLLGGAAAAWPLAVRAQPAGMRRIGVLMANADDVPEAQAWVAAFRAEFQKRGWTEGGNVQVDIRSATGDKDMIQRFANELVASQPRAAHAVSSGSDSVLSSASSGGK